MHGSLTSITIRLVPTLINRGALSLKKAADASGEYSGGWSMGHFSTVKFFPMPALASSTSFSAQPLGDSLETRFDTDIHDDIPLDELDQYTGDHSARVGVCTRHPGV